MEENVNQTVEALTTLLEANPTISFTPVVFHFKTEKVRNADGEVIGEGTKRPSIEMNLPVPDPVTILSGYEEDIRLLKEAILDTVYTRAREILNSDPKKELTAATFPYEQLLWNTIANLPQGEKRGGGISKETWDEFYEDYVAVMVAATGNEKSRVTKAADIFKGRLQAVRSRKDVLAKLKEFLATWYENSTKQEEFVDVFKFLDTKADNFLKEDDKALLEALE